MPLGDGSEALVHSIPDLHHLIDDDGDGKSDRREVWYASIGFRDTHGMANNFTWGYDGWIYGCHGFSNTSTIAGRDGEEVTMNSGNTYRLRPDGSHIEQRTWGQVNPFGLSFDRRGDIYSCDCHSKPIYQLLAGAYYPSFGKPDDGLGYGPVMCRHDHGSTGIAGIVYCAALQFPREFRDNILIGNVVTSRINRDTIAWHGSSPEAVEQPDFLVSDDPWFRPVDLEIGPDGALYVADFYNRIIGHYEVPLTHPGRDRERGRVWRIIYTGLEPHEDPVAPRDDWTKASFDDLKRDLGHPNLAVQTLAANEIARRGGDDANRTAREAKADPFNPWRIVRGLWLMQRLGDLSEADLTGAANHPTALVRIHAQRVLGEQDALPSPLWDLAVAGLKDDDPFVRRAAAQALGRHPSPENLRPLLDIRHAADPDDTHLVHVIRMALRDQLRPGDSWPNLGDTAFSEADLHAVADVALGVQDVASARFLLAYLRRFEGSTRNSQRDVYHIARFGEDTLDGDLMELAGGSVPTISGSRPSWSRKCTGGSRNAAAPRRRPCGERAADLARSLLEAKGDEAITAGLDLAGSFRLDALFEPVAALSDSGTTPQPLRNAALSTLLAIDAGQALERIGTVPDRRRGADRPAHSRSEPAGAGGTAGGAAAAPRRPADRPGTAANVDRRRLDREPGRGRGVARHDRSGQGVAPSAAGTGRGGQVAVGRRARTGRASRCADPGIAPR